MKKYVYMIISVCILSIGCGEMENSKVVKSDADILLEKAIIGAGGLHKWKSLDTLKFYKTTKLYLEDGSVQDSSYQLHTYFMYPEMNGQYAYEKDGEKVVVEYINGQMSKKVDNKKVPLSAEETEKLRLGFLGGQFVMCLPFKLNDPGVILTKEASLLEGQPVDVIKASYNSENKNHTKSHDWWHYIDQKTGKHLGYKVFHAPTYAQVINVSSTQIKGIDFPTYRKTYRVLENDEKQYVRGEFWYEYIE